MSSGFLVQHPNRGAVRIGGPDRHAFLQALITNDLNALTPQTMLYACLLSAQGKFLHDFFVTEQGDKFFVECEGGDRTLDLAKRLLAFKLRSKITIDHVENIDVFQSSDGEFEEFKDPRHPLLGYRFYKISQPVEFNQFSVWDNYRISLTVPDGSRDLQVEKSTLAEGRIDLLNGICYTKGCYVGQELTARMHYRGLAKRHLYTVAAANDHPLPGWGVEITAGDMVIGEMRSSCGNKGLALLRDDLLGRLADTPYRIFSSPAQTGGPA